MKTLSIQTTVFPKGERITWVNGMPAPTKRGEISHRFIAWQDFTIKKIYGVNTVKPGGICHQEGQEYFLKQMKEILR